ncbi:MAG: hypothetical protein OXE46_03900 [Chloroflexi bacterium]|nr:hypothetical protein [Chloroflexota bacterium]
MSQREKSTHTQFLETFLNPNGRKPSPSSQTGEHAGTRLLWDCRLNLEYPDPTSSRVDWGQSIRKVQVEVGMEPSEELVGSANLILEWVDASGRAQEIDRRDDAIHKRWGQDRVQASFVFSDWQILRGKASQERQIECPVPGECRLRAVVEHRGVRVKIAARTVYVQTEPPPPPEQNPISLSISAANISADDKLRFEHGEILQAQFNARNRTPQADTYYLTARLDSEVLARKMPIELPGTPVGDTPKREPVLSIKRQLLDPHLPAPLNLDAVPSLAMGDSSGRFSINAELADEAGNRVANASHVIHFQRDPGHVQGKLPFDISQVSQQNEMWKLNEELTELTYPSDYPLYKEMQVVQRQRRALQGNLAFIAEISAYGLLEWALRPKEHGNDSNYDQLLETIASPDNPIWEPYLRRLEKLGSISKYPFSEYAQLCRETVAIMLEIFAKEND